MRLSRTGGRASRLDRQLDGVIATELAQFEQIGAVLGQEAAAIERQCHSLPAVRGMGQRILDSGVDQHIEPAVLRA
ncbi:hypothetical protein A6I77_18450 [Achromobacter xylosoxidans]|nr:hypothetical protein A6I77_18450 [Achromobacter xylosoxidans]